MDRFLKWAGRTLTRRGDLHETVSLVSLFSTFKRILELNNTILELIADMGDKLGGDYVFDRQYIHSSCRQMDTLVYELIYNFHTLAPKKYQALDIVFRSIKKDIEKELAGQVVIPQTEYVISYDIITGDFDDVVGGKNTHIAEVRNRLGMRVPEGFAITTRAFQSFLDYNRIQDKLAGILENWEHNRISTRDASQKILGMISSSAPAPALSRAIKRGTKELQQKTGKHPLLLAVRSSAMGEDSEHTFAGQYQSFLNQPPQNLIKCYKDILASAYSPSVMEYRRQKGISEHEVAMAVACQCMIDAKVSGILYSLDPLDPSRDVMVLSAAWGLGLPIVSGKVAADRFMVSRQFPHNVQSLDIRSEDANSNPLMPKCRHVCHCPMLKSGNWPRRPWSSKDTLNAPRTSNGPSINRIICISCKPGR